MARQTLAERLEAAKRNLPRPRTYDVICGQCGATFTAWGIQNAIDALAKHRSEHERDTPHS